MKKMTPTMRAKKVREMADSISVRNHMFAMDNMGRIPKSQRVSVQRFLDYIDGEVFKGCMEIMPENIESIKSAHNSDFVQAREKKQKEKTETVKQAEEVKKGAFVRVNEA